MNHQFLSFCLSTPWALEPGRMRAYAAVLARRYALRDGLVAGGLDEDDHGAPLKVSAGPARAAPARSGNIAVVGVYGTIVQRASQLGLCEGGTTTQQVSAALQQCLADETVGQILMDFDTPGGSVFGVSELGDEIRAARTQKPIVGIANSMCASAGYWLMSQCGEAYCTPGGQVGSIGVWTAHEDLSKALAEAGVAVTLISAGKYKVEGNPYQPLGEEALAATQKSVDDYYSMFTAAVAKGRGVPIDQVRSGMGEGRMCCADDAVANKMVDGVATFADVVKKMQRAAKAAPAGGRSARANANDLALLSL